MTELANETAAGFQVRYGYQPSGVWSAPGRVNLIGEHTDYNGGFVLPLAINRRTYAAVALRADSLIRVASSFTSEAVEIDLEKINPGLELDWAAYPLGMAWAVRSKAIELGHQAPEFGFDAYIHSDVPVGAGLSSSAAIECAIGVALNELWHLDLDERTLARCGQLGENQIVGAPTGIMDQSASMLGIADHGVLLDCRTLETEPIELGFAAAGLELLIIDTRVAHRLVDGGYAERRAACESSAAKLNLQFLRDLDLAQLADAEPKLTAVEFRRTRHVVTEISRVLETVATLKSKGPVAIGGLLKASHDSLRDDYAVSIPELDLAVEAAIDAGALGARMTGGGFGGAAIALTPTSKLGVVSESVKHAFASAGYLAPNIFAVTAADGAKREV